MRSFYFLGLFVLVVACADRTYTPTVPEALAIGKNSTIFAATSRAKEEDGTYGYRRSEKLSLLELTVSIPPSHTPGELRFGYSNPDPETEFTMADRKEFADVADLKSRLAQELRQLPPEQREVTIFVHGYNATQAETAFRAAQLENDLELPGPTVIYSWPSRGKPLGYVYDNDSMLFARDGLETLIRETRDLQVDRLMIVAHSMGSVLTMEALRQIEIETPGWAARALGGVILISPDIDVEVFRRQFERFDEPPKPFLVFVSNEDKALSLSGRLRGGQQRLGNISNIELVQDLPIEIIDTTAFSDDAGSSHLVALTSPTLLAMLNGAKTMNDTFDTENVTIENVLMGNVVMRSGLNRVTLLRGDEGAR